MGDTGSMVIGFILTFMAIRFLYISETSNLGLKTGPVLLLFIFVIPIVDTSYVFTVRLLRKRSPFAPDKNHLHHQFLKLGYNHLQTSIILVLINIFFIIVGYYFRNIEINKLFLVFIVLSISFVISLRYIVVLKNNKNISL